MTHSARPLYLTASFVALAPAVLAQSNSLVSVSSAGAQANDGSYFSLISDDGRYVVFASDASNLAAGDSNNRKDIFRRDLVSGTTEIVSVDVSGASSSNGLGLAPSMSADGRYVAFQSNGNNIVPGDTNGDWDCFVRDMQSGVTERVSLTSTGAQATDRSDSPVLSPDGRFVIFESDAALVPADVNGQKDVYRLDRQSGALDLVSVTQAGVQGDGWSYHGDISDDGRYACFTSGSTNLVPGDTNGHVDMFWKDLQTGELRRVTVSSTGVQANNTSDWPYLSGDGQTVVFSSSASNLVTGDSNGDYDLFAHDLATATTERVSVSSAGAQGNDSTRSPVTVSPTGRFVIFASTASNLVANDGNMVQDIFLRDRAAQTTDRVNLNQFGQEANDWSFVPAMSANARFITYTSDATDIVPNDVNGERDIFAADLMPSVGTNYCGPAQLNSTGNPATIVAEGSSVVANNDFTLRATSLPANQFGIFLVAPVTDFVVNPGGTPGNLCLGGAIGRFYGPGEIRNAGAAGEFSLAVDLTWIPQGLQRIAIQSGETWYFQAWFRDVAPGVGPSNFTDGIEIAFQ